MGCAAQRVGSARRRHRWYHARMVFQRERLRARDVLSNEEIRRYSRQLLLPEIAAVGQRRLKDARVLCVGVGGLGSPVSMYLAAAGVGTLGLVDFDDVDVSNLQRQVLYVSADEGKPKVERARARLSAMNPTIRVETHALALSSGNALDLFRGYDIIADCSDNFPARYLVNDACVLLGKPDVSGSVLGFEGQVSVYGTSDGPCYRCLHPEPPAPRLVPSCGEAGVLGALPGIIGTIQAAEVIKIAAGAGETLAGRLMILDALRMRFREVRIAKDADCAVCGAHPTIRQLTDYELLCGITPIALPPECEVSAGQLKARLDLGDPVMVVDVREPQESDINGIPGSIAIPLEALETMAPALDRGSEIVVYCKVGVRSAAAVEQLRTAGFEHVAHLKGGILSWIDEVDPGQPKY
jgi:molybdopterin/thiamine biosynthesis adenylyltransferase/rhodanese-related sulfurtransferase